MNPNVINASVKEICQLLIISVCESTLKAQFDQDVRMLNLAQKTWEIFRHGICVFDRRRRKLYMSQGFSSIAEAFPETPDFRNCLRDKYKSAFEFDSGSKNI